MNKIKQLNPLGLILIILGLLGVLLLSMSQIFARFEQIKLIEKPLVTVQPPNSNSNNTNTTEQLTYDKPAPEALAILEIPSLSIKYPVRSGSDASILKYSLGHIENTALPSELGNFAVAGHRNSSYSKYFKKLNQIKIDDLIYVTTNTHQYIYTVTSKDVVSYTDISVLEQTDSKTITLITCTNGLKPTKRIAVHGTLLSEKIIN